MFQTPKDLRFDPERRVPGSTVARRIFVYLLTISGRRTRVLIAISIGVTLHRLQLITSRPHVVPNTPTARPDTFSAPHDHGKSIFSELKNMSEGQQLLVYRIKVHASRHHSLDMSQTCSQFPKAGCHQMRYWPKDPGGWIAKDLLCPDLTLEIYQTQRKYYFA